MVNHGQIPDVKLTPLGDEHGWTMVLQCFDHGWTMVDHGWTMVDHGQVKSGNHGLTMVNHGQFHIQKSNDHGQSWSNTWCPDLQINTPGGEHGWNHLNQSWSWSVTMVDHGLAMFWPGLNHGWPWSGNHDQSWSVPHLLIKMTMMNYGQSLMCRQINMPDKDRIINNLNLNIQNFYTVSWL